MYGTVTFYMWTVFEGVVSCVVFLCETFECSRAEEVWSKAEAEWNMLLPVTQTLLSLLAMNWIYLMQRLFFKCLKGYPVHNCSHYEVKLNGLISQTWGLHVFKMYWYNIFTTNEHYCALSGVFPIAMYFQKVDKTLTVVYILWKT